MNFIPLVIEPKAFYDLMIHPHFADAIDGVPQTSLSTWTILDDVSSKRQLIDVIGNGTILKQRDATCNTVFTPVASIEKRCVETIKCYAATITCQEEFYKNCLTDFYRQAPKFRDVALMWFQKLFVKDLYTNAWVGKTTRTADVSGVWGWNTFDGVLTHIESAITSGDIPASQVNNLAGGAITDANAYAAVKWTYDNQSQLLETLPEADKVIYVTQKVFNGYVNHLISLGVAFNLQYAINGLPQAVQYMGVDVVVEPLLGAVMSAINTGTQANLAMLTVKGNLVFATDSEYGSGADMNQALRVWFSDDDESWKYKAAIKAGTQIAVPELIVINRTVLP